VLDNERCVVTLNAQFDTRGVLGTLARWILLAQLRRTSRHLGDAPVTSLSTAHRRPRKLKQLKRRHRTT